MMLAGWQWTTQSIAATLHIGNFRAVLGWPVIGNSFQFIISHRNTKAIAKISQTIQIQFLNRMGIIGRLTVSKTIAFNRMGQNNGGLATARRRF